MLKDTEKLLLRHGISNARQETKWLFDYCKGDTVLFNKLVSRRANGEPLQYLFGEWEFYGLTIKVGDGVLIPRPETETLVNLSLGHLKKSAQKEQVIIDLCSGTACISIAVCKNSSARAFAVELSPPAIKFARENIKLHGLEERITLIQGDVFAENIIKQTGFADCILANPPYLTETEMRTLQKEVTHEPPSALFGGTDGLDYYRKILPLWKHKLKQGGLLAVEFGDVQALAVSGIMRDNGIEPEIVKDMFGTDRAAAGVKRG